MRPAEYPNLPEENHRDPATFPLADLGPKLNKQGLDVAPVDIGAHRAGKDGLKGLLVLPLCAEIVPD